MLMGLNQLDAMRQSQAEAVASLHKSYTRDMRPDSTKRNRIQVRFELNVRSLDEFDLAHWLDSLKLGRSMTPVIRSALMLFRSLQQGRTEILEAMFPEVVRCIAERHATVGQGEIAELRAELAAIRADMQARPGPQPLPVPHIPAPADDLADALVMRKAESDGKSAANFLQSAMNLIQ